jgi:hypothetical protein
MGNNNSTPGNNTSAPTGNNGTKTGTGNNTSAPTSKNTKNSSLTNAATATPPAPAPETTPNESETPQIGGYARRANRRRGHKRSHRRRRTHRRYRGGAGLTLRYPKGRAFTPTGPSFGMNNPTFSPSVNSSRRSSVVSMSNAEMSAYANMPSESLTNNGNIRRAAFAPTTVRKNRKSRKGRKNRKGRRN